MWTDDVCDFDVVVNGEGQFSVWPADDAPPAGWDRVGVTGTKDQCLDHIAAVWRDLCPRSVRALLPAHRAGAGA